MQQEVDSRTGLLGNFLHTSLGKHIDPTPCLWDAFSPPRGAQEPHATLSPWLPAVVSTQGKLLLPMPKASLSSCKSQKCPSYCNGLLQSLLFLPLFL